MITQDQLKEVLHYCPETGVFTWLVPRGQVRWGAEAGSIHCNPASGKLYRRVAVCGRRFREHRLAFLYMTGEFPENDVDHIDGNGLNNVWSNLRAVTRSEK